ncbi:hypothetical protein B4589_009495 [Halolamina sp. CBA1230]|uniref:hypothetical protein n=1 Tax=Halolamina sp. CBA1230 TaxID=1853690 RepID=UPI0009A24E41|nr:hypothetical protein [Halolamina sp. CBA1230]QKY20599.1 hypothetical protein B4589_009495 [Halolamina sp. CBA1230]
MTETEAIGILLTSPEWFHPSYTIHPITYVLAAGYLAWDWWINTEEEEPDEWTPEGSAAAYSRGEISRDEHARRSAAAIEAGEEFRAALERVDGVGPSLSGPIRAEFPGEEFVRGATQEELAEVHGVGESKAAALKERFS